MPKILDKPTPSAKQIAKKFGKPVSFIQHQIKMGQKVEGEHTSKTAAAKEIARDHITERPDYYKKLKKMEKTPVKLNEISKALLTRYYEKAMSKPFSKEHSIMVNPKARHREISRLKGVVLAAKKGANTGKKDYPGADAEEARINKQSTGGGDPYGQPKRIYEVSRELLGRYLSKISKMRSFDRESPYYYKNERGAMMAITKMDPDLPWEWSPKVMATDGKKKMKKLEEGNKANKQKKLDWEKENERKGDKKPFDPRRMLAPHNRLRFKKKIDEADVSGILKNVGKEFMAHSAMGAVEKGAHSLSNHGHEGGDNSFASKAKDVAKTAADIAVPGSVDAYHQAKKGEYGKAASTFATGVVRTGLGLATKGASEVLSPTPASAKENEFERQKSMQKEENIISEALSNLVDRNFIVTKEKLQEALQEKVMEALEERKKAIAASYFGQ